MLTSLLAQLKDEDPLINSGYEPLYKIDKVEDFRTELKRLNRDMLSCVVDLMKGEKSLKDSHADGAEIRVSIEEKVKKIKLSAINMHHLLNRYRKHQSRQTVLHLMKEQLRKNKEALEILDGTVAEAAKKLESADGAT